MNTSGEPLVPREFERALYQVATLASLQPGPSDIESLHAGLVLQTIDQLAALSDPEAIAEAIRRLGIAIPIEDVVRAVGVLLEDGRLERAEGYKVRITGALKSQLATEASQASSLKKTVIDEWLKSIDQELVEEGAQALTGLEVSYLEDDLEVFLLQTVRYHGAEVVAFLYPDASFPRNALEIDEKLLFRELPKREDRLDGIRHKKFPAFIREARGDRATFIAGLLHRAALVQILQADPSASSLFAEVISPKTFFLDTNFVFRLLGLQGKLLKQAAADVLKIGKPFGHSFKVSSRTFSELENLVRKQAEWLMQKPEIPQPLAEVAADFVAGNDYVSAYWKDRASSGVSADQFRETYSQLALLLENEDIEITNVLSAEISGSYELREAVLGLKILKPLESDALVEHDAFHKVLIEKLRLETTGGMEPQGWHEVPFLFLTFDHRLPLFALRAAQQRKGQKIPFCLMANEWLQILYFLRRDITINPTTFVSLLNSPYLQTYFSQRAVNRDMVRNVMAVMGEMGELRPQVARKILVNRVLRKALESTADSPTKERFIKEAVVTESRAEDERVANLIKQKDDEIVALRNQINQIERSERRRDVRPHPGPGAPSRKHLRRLEEEVKSLKDLATANPALREEIQSLKQDLDRTRAMAISSQRLLLLVPAALVISGVAELASADPNRLFGIIAILLGVTPFIAGAVKRFRGRIFEVINNLSAILGIIAFVWEFVPGVKEAVRQLFRAK